MNLSQRLRTCAKHTGLDAVTELLQEAADEIDALQARAQAQGEPSWWMRETDEGAEWTDTAPLVLRGWTPLYTAPQPAQVQGEPVMDVRCEGCGYMTHHREHMGCVRAAKQHTHPAPSVPADVVRNAERYRFILAAADDMTTSRYKSLCELLGVAITEDFDLGAAIDAAMLAAKKPSA